MKIVFAVLIGLQSVVLGASVQTGNKFGIVCSIISIACWSTCIVIEFRKDSIARGNAPDMTDDVCDSLIHPTDMTATDFASNNAWLRYKLERDYMGNRIELLEIRLKEARETAKKQGIIMVVVIGILIIASVVGWILH